MAKEAHEQLAISDAKLGGVIKVSDSASMCADNLQWLSVAKVQAPNPLWFSGKAATELRLQLCRGRADAVHQESDGESHHRPAFKGAQRHVSRISSQVCGAQTGQCIHAGSAYDYTCCLNPPCGFSTAFVTTSEAAISQSTGIRE